MDKGTQQVLISLVIVLLVLTFYLIYKDIIDKNAINVKSTMKIEYDASAKTLKYSFLVPALDMKYAGTNMLLTSFDADETTKSSYTPDDLNLFVSALQTLPTLVAITPIDTLSNYVETTSIPKVIISKGLASMSISGPGVIRITPN